MNASTPYSIRHLNDCGCCDGVRAAVPVKVSNRAGLAAIAYRIGTHAQFKASLLARLSAPAFSALQGLRSREDDDFSIALLDAWAVMADILTFYIERGVQESYLRTASERLSILELARLIGYRPHPGVAASTNLVFMMDETPGSPEKIALDVGTKVQSTPGQDEQAQVFETVETIEARPAWNGIRPRLTKLQVPTASTRELSFEGIATGIVPGDAVIFTPDGGGNIFAVVRDVNIDPENEFTQIGIAPLATAPIHGFVATDLAIAQGLPPPVGNYLGKTWAAADLEAEAKEHGFRIQDIFNALSANVPALRRALVFRQRAAIFGHNSPAWESLPESLKGDVPIFKTEGNNVVIDDFVAGEYKYDQDKWPGGDDGHLATLNADDCPKGVAPPTEGAPDDIAFALSINPSIANGLGVFTESPAPVAAGGFEDLNIGDQSLPAKVFLDNVYRTVSTGSAVVLQDGNDWGIFYVQGVTELSKSCFMVTAKVSRLDLDSAEKFEKFSIRGTSVYLQSEFLPLARVPVGDAVPVGNSQTLELNGWVDGLQKGQQVVVTGKEIGGSGEALSEFVRLDKIEHILTREGCTRITFTPALQHTYARETISINANVASATHGETVQEVLGSGDASRTYQQFVLRQTPHLTHVPAATPAGAASTLELRVNDIRWHEKSMLYGRKPDERIFVTRTTDDGQTIVAFGNGHTGARLSSGQDNVRAGYRKGLGLDGLVGAGQLDMLMSRPLGLKAATNPQAATGAADPEPLNEARRNAPLTVLTLDRTVSLQDYEDFSRGFGGIAKALATWSWDGHGRRIFITVAGPDGAAVEIGSQLHTRLLQALKQAGDPLVPFTVRSYRPALFRLAARVKVHADFITEVVLAEVEAALRSHFSFDTRQFGQPVMLSQVIAQIQAVPGVIAVDIDHLYRGDVQDLQPRIIAQGAWMNSLAQMQAAELLTMHPGPLDYLEVMA